MTAEVDRNLNPDNTNQEVSGDAITATENTYETISRNPERPFGSAANGNATRFVVDSDGKTRRLRVVPDAPLTPTT